MEVFDSRNDLVEELAGFGLLDPLVGDDVLEELAPAGVLHYEVELLWSFDYLRESVAIGTS